MNLFKLGKFVSASGKQLNWKIECDALTDKDWETIAHVLLPSLQPFSKVVGVPRGGLKLATKLQPFYSKEGSTLVVDDVWTTGKSMHDFVETQNIEDWKGAVAFCRGRPPPWITAFATINEETKHESC